MLLSREIRSLSSSHFTQKKVNGHTCLDEAHREGHVVINGHTLTIKRVYVDRINKVSTERSIVDFDTGKGVFNCVDKIFDSKP
jgi:ABC-type phosphate/phosphonate transport system ATPase subunit